MSTPTDVPVTDLAVDTDPEVAAIEERIAAGDDTVTESALGKVRAAAANRLRFGRLRGVAAERQAARDAEERERDRAVAAEEHARTALHGCSDVDLVPLYDAAVEAVRALSEAMEGRNDVLRRLCALPTAERVRGVEFALIARGEIPAQVPLPEGDVVAVGHDHVIRRVLAAATVDPARLTAIPREYARSDEDPVAIARGRERLARG